MYIPQKGVSTQEEQQFIGFTRVRSRVLRTPPICVGSKINGLLQFAAQTYYLQEKMYSELFAVDRDVYIPREAQKNLAIYMLHPHRLQHVQFDFGSATNNIGEV